MIVLWKLGHCDIVCKQRHQLNLYGKISSTTLFYIFYILGRVCKIPVKNSCTVTDDGQLTKCHSHTYVMYQQVCPLFFNCTTTILTEPTRTTILTEPTNSTSSKPSTTIKQTTNNYETQDSTTIYVIVILIMFVCLIVLIILVCKRKLGGNSSLINQAFEMSSF